MNKQYTDGIMKLGGQRKKKKKQTKQKKKGYVQVLYTLTTNNFLQNNHTRKQKHKIFVILPL